LVAVQVLRATEETIEPWLPLAELLVLPGPPFAWVGDKPPTTANATAIASAIPIDAVN
jgi:hypothetical protein